MGDLISRKATIEEVYKEKYNLTLDDKADVEEIINNMPTAFDLESVIAELEERLKQLREEQSEDCKKHDGYWTPEQGVRGGTIKAYLEILEVLKSAANATNGKIGG